jgi:hypothetical protein
MTLAEELANSLEREGKKTLEFFQALRPEKFPIQIYPNGAAWTVHNLLAHFVEVEGSIRTLIERIVQGGEGVAEDFNIDRWNARYTAEMSQHADAYLLSEFGRRRAATVTMARGLSAADLEKRGRHPFLGVTEVKHMLKLMYVHLLGHQRDIRKALNKAQSVD